MGILQNGALYEFPVGYQSPYQGLLGKQPPMWAQLLGDAGLGLLRYAAQPGAGLNQALLGAAEGINQGGQQRQQMQRQAWQDQMTQQQFDMTRSEAEARAAEREAEKARRERVRRLLMGGPPMPIDQGGPAAGQFMTAGSPGLANDLGLPEALSRALGEEGDPTVFASLFGQKATRDAQAERDAAGMAWDREKFDKQYALDVKQLGVSAANAAAARRLQEAELDLKRQELKGTGPFQGTSMEAQDSNILLMGDPASPAYKAAYNRQAQEKIQVAADGTVVRVRPDMSAYRVPSFTGAAADNLPPTGLQTSGAYGSPAQVTQDVGNRGTPSERASIRQATAAAEQLSLALNKYAEAASNANAGELAESNFGLTTPVSKAFSNAALLAKGEELYNLGVLQKVDVEWMAKTLPDPTSMRGALSIGEAVNSVNEVLDLMEAKLNSRRAALGLDPVKLPRPGQANSTRPSADELAEKWGIQ